MNPSQAVHYLTFFINLALVTAILYFTIEGYNKYNNCASTKLLYEVFFIEAVVVLVLCVAIMVVDAGWA